MRRQVTKNRSAKSARRSYVTIAVVALIILALGSVAIASRQKLATKSTAAPTDHKAFAGVPTIAAQNTLNESPREDDEKLAAGLREVINQSTDGLTEVHHSDGSVSLNLEERFQNVSVAKVTNGKLSQSCLDNPQSAGVFFGIDPRLIDNKARAQVAPVPNQ